MRRSILCALSLSWTVLGQTHLLCPAQAAGSNLVANPSFEASNPADQWTPQQAMFYGIGKFNPADGSSYFIIPIGGITGSGTLQQNVTVERDTRYYGSIKVRPRVANPPAAQSSPPRTCTATAALQGAIGGTFQDTATFFVRPDAVFDWETLGFDFKNPFTGSVRFIMTTSCDGGMPSLEMDFDDALVQRLDGGELCSSPERPVPITGNVPPVPPTSESTTFATSTGSPSSSSAASSSAATTSATTDPAISTVQVTVTAAPLTTTTYTTVTQTTTSTVTVYASTVSRTVTVTEAIATTTVTVEATVAPPARLRRRGCKQHTASNSATSSATSIAEPSYETASSQATTSVSPPATISSESASSTITSATDSPSASSSTVTITGTTTVTTTVTPIVTVDGGSTTVNVPAGTTTITEPITTVTATAISSVTSTVSTTITVA
ncbi:hypothetical protein MN608_03176 [Microdochium nivale]|nr:hypothetical protein MN608_03176 [Microdochium nivale]